MFTNKINNVLEVDIAEGVSPRLRCCAPDMISKTGMVLVGPGVREGAPLNNIGLSSQIK